MKRVLIEGSEAIARAMVAADCRFFSGYPMTPFTEVLEHMARLLPEVDGVCVNAESEIEAVGMAWGAAATGTRSATGSVGQGLSLMQESLSEMCRARLPLVVLNMARGQGDYFQATRGGGHGDYHQIVLAPASVSEAVLLVQQAFDLADRWRNPVVVLGDYYLAHTEQAVDIAPVDFGLLPAKDWSLDGSSGGTGSARLISPINPNKRTDPDYVSHGKWLMAMGEHMSAMAAGVEPMVETVGTDEAEVVVVAYGTPARYLHYVVEELRAEGHPIGLVRPLSLWPFPSRTIAEVASWARQVLVYELNTGQMLMDVQLAVMGACPVSFIGGISFDSSGFGIAPDLDTEILAARLRSHLARIPAVSPQEVSR